MQYLFLSQNPQFDSRFLQTCSLFVCSLGDLGGLVVADSGIKCCDEHEGFIQDLGDAFFVGGDAAYAVFDKGGTGVGEEAD